ncbi:hypothetical protein CCP3SC1AL1_570017 [Gammaproteobacteria bacterium]
MPDLKPKFDPNKPYTEIDTPIANKPKFDPNKPYEKAEVTTEVVEPKVVELDHRLENATNIINDIPNISEYQKNHLKNLTIKGANKEQLSQAIQGFQNQNKKDIHVWSDKPEASYGEYAWNKLASGSAHLGSILAKAPEMALNIVNAPFNYVASGRMTEDLNAVPNVPESLKNDLGLNDTPFKASDVAAQLGIKENKIAKYYDEDVKARQAITASKYDKTIEEYIANEEYGKALGATSGAVLESAPVTISLMMGNAAGIGAAGSTLGGGVVFAADKKSELDNDEAAKHLSEQEKLNIAMSNGLFEGLFEQFGVTKLGSITKNILLRSGKEEAKKIAKEGFKDVYLPALQKFVGTSLAEESLSEAGTQFAQNAVDIYSGYKPDKDIMEGVVDAAIVGAASGGVMGAGPAMLEVGANKKANQYADIIQQEDKRAKENIKNEHAFHVANQGTDAVENFNRNVLNAIADGNLTLEEGEKARHRVNAYAGYVEQTADLKLDDNTKKEIFNLSYQKQGLESEVPSDVVEKDLSPIELAKRNAKQVQIKGLQKDIDNLVLNGQVKDEPIVASETEKKVDANKEQIDGELSDTEKELRTKAEEHKGETGFLPHEEVKRRLKIGDIPAMNEVDPAQFNKEASKGLPGYNHRVKYKQVADHIDSTVEGKESGVLKVVDTKHKNEKGVWRDIKTIEVELPSGHKIRMSSSMAREDSDLMGHFREENLPKKTSDARAYKEMENFPVKMKIVKTTPGINGENTAIKVYNANTGKILGWAKATTKGQDALAQPIITRQEREAKKPGITREEQAAELKRREDLAREEMVIEPIDTLPINTPINEKTGTNGNVSQEAKAAEKEAKQQAKSEGEKAQKIAEFDAKTIESKPTEISINEFERNNLLDGGHDNTSIDNAIAEANRILKLPLREMVAELRKVGILNYGDKSELHPFIGLSSQEMEDTFRQIEEGKYSKTVERLFYYLNKVKETGEYKIVSGSGGTTLKYDMPLFLNFLEGKNERGLTAIEEQEFLAKEQARKEAEDNGLYQKKGELEVSKLKELDLNSYSKDELNNLIDQLETGMSDILRTEGFNKKAQELNDLIGKVIDVYTSKQLLQKQKNEKGNLNIGSHERVLEVAKRIQKAFPKVKVVFNPKLSAAGRLKGNIIEINPYYASADTPIHEGAHIILDAIGHNNKVIQAAIKQIKASPEGAKMWEKVQERYKELSVEGQENELLAEAIGIEGKGIFDKVVEQSKFKNFLDYIFNWVKQKLGLDKNIAKSLAKQIISGIGTKKLEGLKETESEKLQKPTKKYDTNEEGEAQSFAEFRADQWDRDVEKEAADIEYANEIIKDKNSTDAEVKAAKGLKENILSRMREDKKNYMDYKNAVTSIEDLLKEDNLEDFTKEELMDAYWNASYYMDNNSELFKKAQTRIAILLQNEQIKKLQEKNPDFKKEDVGNEDIGPLFKIFGALSDATAKHPALQSLSLALDRAFLAKRQETAAMKTKHEALAKAVIKEKNKQLGIVKGTGKGLFSSNSAKYFEYVDNGKGQVLTEQEAKDKGLSKAQTEYLNYFRELNNLRNAAYDENDNIIENDIIKVDPKFREQWKQGGFVSALNAYLTGATDLETEIETSEVDPVTKEKLKKSYGDIQQELNNGKGNVVGRIMKAYSIAFKARKAAGINTKNSSISYKGGLTLKSDRVRPKDRGYSKDFYAAANSLIDDYSHVKNMTPLIPLFDSVQQLYKKTVGHESNAVDFIEGELQDKIYQNQGVGVLGAKIDAIAKWFRTIGSLNTMAFNLPANIINVGIGNYSNLRKEGLAPFLKGNDRMFRGGRATKRAGERAISKKALDILEDYSVIHPDFDSNPQMKLGGIFNKLAYFFNQMGEYQISGSMFLGHMTKDEWNSFELKDGKYQLKPGVDKVAFAEKMQSYKDMVSGIQGKYDEKDRRMFMRTELGKAVAQYKTWMPDWIKSRFGAEFINKYGNKEIGSVRSAGKVVVKSFKTLTEQGVSELMRDMKSGLEFDKKNGRLKNREFAANLNGAIAIASIYLLINGGDEDKKKKKKKYYDQLSLENALGNLLFIYDPDQMIYLIEHPIALQSTVTNFIKAVNGVITGNTKDMKKYGTKVLPYGKLF